MNNLLTKLKFFFPYTVYNRTGHTIHIQYQRIGGATMSADQTATYNDGIVSYPDPLPAATLAVVVNTTTRVPELTNQTNHRGG